MAPGKPEHDDADGPVREARKDALVGAVFAGRFRLLAPIARGGMSRVYRAEQLPLGRPCAVKVLTPKFEGQHDEEFQKRFFLEASTAAKLTHPNTVRIFDYGHSVEHDAYYIAMELVEGRTLHQTLREDGAFDEFRAAHVAIEIARALREAHAVGVVHRDLKPGNIMLQPTDGDGERESVKVLDFGLVKDFTGEGEDLTETGMFLGSPKYMAPEQVLGEAIGPATDVYAVGVLLYEMLTGKVPFDKGVGTLIAHVNDPVPTFADKNPRVAPSVELSEVVYRCLEKAPEMRYANMGELVKALRVSTGGGVSITETQELPRVSAPTLAEAVSRSAPPPSVSATFRGASVTQKPDAMPAREVSAPSFPPPRRYGPRVAAVLALAAGAAGAAAFLQWRASRADDVHPPAAANNHEDAVSAPAVAHPDVAYRMLRIESTPPGAEVFEAGKLVCTTTPCIVTWRGADAAAVHKLELQRPGYRAAPVAVGDSEEAMLVRLASLGSVDHAATSEPPAPAASSIPSVAPVASPIAEPSPKATAAPVSGVVAPPGTAGAVAPPVAPAGAIVPFGEGMTRPTFVAGQMPAYTREALEAKVQGKVIVKCVIQTSGATQNCRVVKGLPFMDQAVLAAMATHRYTPVLLDGRPVPVEYVFTLRLVLP